MLSKKYPFEEDGKNRLKIQWKGRFFSLGKDFQIFVDGKLIGTLPDRRNIENGWKLLLENGKLLSIKLGDILVVVLFVLVSIINWRTSFFTIFYLHFS